MIHVMVMMGPLWSVGITLPIIGIVLCFFGLISESRSLVCVGFVLNLLGLICVTVNGFMMGIY